ncbi:MAG: hypothetical protein BroJett018_54750 [Chloroflexota bacterium]|nr:MAG: hypothetical protein BroJett018_54750 [Chloroflexota bacterium]
MWRVVVRLTCIVMGGVLVVMTLGIGVQRDDTLPRLLILRRDRWMNGQYSPIWMAYHPESQQQWLLGKLFQGKSGYDLFSNSVEGLIFRGGDGYLYQSTSLTTNHPQRISSLQINTYSFHPITLSPNRAWLIYRGWLNSGELTDLFAIRLDDVEEYSLTRDLPQGFEVYRNDPIAVSPNSELIAFAAVSQSPQQVAVFLVRNDGTDLRLLWSQPNNEVRSIRWSNGKVIIEASRRPYSVDTDTGKTLPLIAGAYLGYFLLVNWLPQTDLFLFRHWAHDTHYLLGVHENGTVAWTHRDYGIAGLPELKDTIFTYRDSLGLIDPQSGEFVPLSPNLRADYTFHYGFPTDQQWLVFNAVDEANYQDALWRFDVNSHQLTHLWGPSGVNVFDVWVSPDGQEILVDAATPTWAGLLRLNPDGSNVRELTSVQDIELGEHDFVDWATFPDRAWQPVALGGGGIGLVVISMGWPIVSKFVSRRRHLA